MRPGRAGRDAVPLLQRPPDQALLPAHGLRMQSAGRGNETRVVKGCRGSSAAPQLSGRCSAQDCLLGPARLLSQLARGRQHDHARRAPLLRPLGLVAVQQALHYGQHERERLAAARPARAPGPCFACTGQTLPFAVRYHISRSRTRTQGLQSERTPSGTPVLSRNGCERSHNHHLERPRDVQQAGNHLQHSPNSSTSHTPQLFPYSADA